MKALIALVLGILLFGCASGGSGKVIASEDGKFTLEADDLNYYFAGEPVGGIRVKKGQAIEISFKVSKTNVYYEGLGFRGCGAASADGLPGETVEFSFTAEENCQVISVWPENGAPKKSLEVTVE